MISAIWQDPAILTKDILLLSLAVGKCYVRWVTPVSGFGTQLVQSQKWIGGWILVIYRLRCKILNKVDISGWKRWGLDDSLPEFFVHMAAGEYSDIVPCCQSLHIWLCLAGCGLASAMWLSVGCYCSSPGRLGLFRSRDFGRSPNQATD